MSAASELITDPNAYGSKGHKWHPAFVEYMISIARHPSYRSMPDLVNAEGKIQWEAPSNRGAGIFQNTHHKRRDWWRDTARRIGIDPNTDKWISRTAKQLHPTKSKPCKRCGTVLRIAYAYPNATLVRRIKQTFDIEFADLEEIGLVVGRILKQNGPSASPKLASILSTSDIKTPANLHSLEEWQDWLEKHYIPSEPSLLSPGAMSNAPDRFDGFHSFNLCCRKKADTGRHDTNMRTYSTDRRVFEFWSEGDWISADRLMALVGARFRDAVVQDGKIESASADHIGPLSLGFCHRPEFLLLSRSGNSSKNNRMRHWDVQYLVSAETSGQKVVSWYAKSIWDLLKGRIENDEAALRLSKIMRDNQRHAMLVLHAAWKKGYLTFLMSLLELHHAGFDPDFVNLRIEKHLTIYDSITKPVRTTKYALEQKARRVRIALDALNDYGEKINRHSAPLIPNAEIAEAEIELWVAIETDTLKAQALEEKLRKELPSALASGNEEALRQLVSILPDNLSESFSHSRNALARLMAHVAGHLSSEWESARYIRGEFSFD